MSTTRKTFTDASGSQRSKKPRILPPSPHGPFWNGTTTNPKTITVLEKERDHVFHYDARVSRLDLVQDIWEFEIIPSFNVKELAVLRPTCRWCNEQWQEFLKRDTLRVPEQVPTIEEAMRIGFNLAKQKIFSKESPLMVVLGEGEHRVEESCPNGYGRMFANTMVTTCSNISFIGQGKDKTTIRGAFVVMEPNVMVKSLTFTNPNPHGYGLTVLGREASVEMMDVSVKGCGGFGLRVEHGASVKAIQCEFSENGKYGVIVSGTRSKGIFTDCTIHHNGKGGVYASVYAEGEGMVEIHGEQTEIHHSGHFGLLAFDNAIINIYIPSRSITDLIHDNGVIDIHAFNGGKIQSQLSSSSLELTVLQEAPVESDWE